MEEATELTNVLIAFRVILEGFGAIAVIGAGIKIISDFLKPHKDLEKKVETVERNQGKDYKRLNRMEATQNAQSILLIEIANHLVTGNDKDKLKEKADDLLECITRCQMEESVSKGE